MRRVVGVVLAEVADHLAVAVDGDALGDEVLLDHVEQGRALDVLGVAARERGPSGLKFGSPPSCTMRCGDLVGVLLLLVRVLEELGRHAPRRGCPSAMK